jgi:hypothetical protein
MNFYNLGDFGLPDLDGDGGQSFAHFANPLVAAQRGGRHVKRMSDLVQITDRDSAGA